MHFVPWDRLKYLDEASYNMKGILSYLFSTISFCLIALKDLRKCHILGPAGVSQMDMETELLDLVYNTTIVTNLSSPYDPPFFVDLRQTTNDQ
jgi:hypothetical protein